MFPVPKYSQRLPSLNVITGLLYKYRPFVVFDSESNNVVFSAALFSIQFRFSFRFTSCSGSGHHHDHDGRDGHDEYDDHDDRHDHHDRHDNHERS